MERSKGLAHRCGIAGFIIVSAALHHGDAGAFPGSDDESPGVARDAGGRKAGQVPVGDLDRLAQAVGDRAEARAEHDGGVDRAYAPGAENLGGRLSVDHARVSRPMPR